MTYRVIERQGRTKELVWECQMSDDGNYFQTMKKYKKSASKFDYWVGDHFEYAIFDSKEKAISFIEENKPKFPEREVYRTFS